MRKQRLETWEEQVSVTINLFCARKWFLVVKIFKTNRKSIYFLNEKWDIIKSRFSHCSPTSKWYDFLQGNNNPGLNMGTETPTTGNACFSCSVQTLEQTKMLKVWTDDFLWQWLSHNSISLSDVGDFLFTSAPGLLTDPTDADLSNCSFFSLLNTQELKDSF